MRFHRTMAIMASCAALGCATTALADDAAPPSRAQRHDKVFNTKTFRISKLTGLAVRNPDGEDLGELYDFVLNVEDGKIQYAALSVGGVLGIGDKLFAVPFDQLKLDHGQDEFFFVLNMSKEKLAAAPGFNQDNWPDFADPEWRQMIDNHYRAEETRTGAKQPASAVNRD